MFSPPNMLNFCFCIVAILWFLLKLAAKVLIFRELTKSNSNYFSGWTRLYTMCIKKFVVIYRNLSMNFESHSKWSCSNYKLAQSGKKVEIAPDYNAQNGISGHPEYTGTGNSMELEQSKTDENRSATICTTPSCKFVTPGKMLLSRLSFSHILLFSKKMKL